MTKKSLSRQAHQHNDANSKTVKKAPVKTVAPPPKAVPKPVVQEPVVEPKIEVIPTPEPEKLKRPRFVREKTEKKKPAKKAPPLPPRSSQPGAKLMSKNLATPPKEDRLNGPKS